MRFICLGSRFMTGGASLGAVMVAKSLIAKGHKCEIWFLLRSGELDTQGVATRIFSETRPRGVLQWAKLFYAYFKQARAYKADAIIGFYSLANILGALTKLCGGTKRMVATQRKPFNMQSKPLYWLEMICGSTSLYDANIAISQSVVQTCAHHPRSYRKKLCVVYNGVPALPQIAQTAEECRAFWGMPEDKFIIGSLGRLDEHKRVDVLIDMMALLPGDCALFIAGMGNAEKKLKAQAAHSPAHERIIFVGNLSAEKVSMFYRAIDVFAFATSFEGFGRTLVEAFSMDVPVVASDIPALREVGGDAAFFAENTAKDWAEAMKEIIALQYLREDIIAKGRERAAQFSLQHMLDTYYEIAAPPSITTKGASLK